MKRFCADGSAEVTTTAKSAAFDSSKTPAPITHATSGCPTDLHVTASRTGSLSCSGDSTALPRRDMPKASSTAGTDIAPTSSKGSSTGAGRVSPVAATVTPASEPITTGLRNGVVMRRSVPLSPVRVEKTSRAVSATGEITSCWKRITGATSDASPRTYAAMGIPRLPAFT